MAKRSHDKVVEAAGTAAAGSNDLSATSIQEAMAQAAADAAEDGVTDSEEIKKRMLDARKSVKNQ